MRFFSPKMGPLLYSPGPERGWLSLGFPKGRAGKSMWGWHGEAGILTKSMLSSSKKGQGLDILEVLLSSLILMKDIRTKQEGKSDLNLRTERETEPKSMKNPVFEPWRLPYKPCNSDVLVENPWTPINSSQLNGAKYQHFYFLEGCGKFSLLFKYFCSYYSFLTHFLFPSLYKKPCNCPQNLPKVWTNKLTQCGDLMQLSLHTNTASFSVKGAVKSHIWQVALLLLVGFCNI